ncbi:MAG: hypothetical protein A3G93_01190 [Nitrospinae bacterium RIFCSPLOWO2_12_FULL_45_22]|nr:MAG: hypothetical protein A3G93_01190 [Nitrospinae bacterium RIFCSPLOWO2_12_FULL_45_22]
MRKIIYLLGMTVIILIAGCSATRTFTSWLPINIFGKQEYGITNKEVKKFIESVRTRPDDPLAAYRLAKYYLSQKQYDRAMEQFCQAIALKPDFLEAHNGLGVTYDLKGMYEESAEEYRLVLNIDPKRVSVLNNLGYSYYLQGRFEEAIKYFKKVLSLDKENRRTRNNLDFTYSKLGTGPNALSGESKTPISTGKVFTQPDGNISPERSFSNKISVAPGLLKAEDESWMLTEFSINEIQLKEPDFILIEESPNISRLEFLTPGEEEKPILQASLNQPGEGKGFRVEVSNGNGLARMASRISEYLKVRGYRVARLTNAEHFGHKNTMIFYQEGYGQQAIALNHEIPGEQELLISSSNRKDIHIRVLLGRDLLPLANLFQEDIQPLKKEEEKPILQASLNQPGEGEGFRVEVSNGNGLARMASRVSEYLKVRGYRVARLTNAEHFGHKNTMILYQEGYGQQAVVMNHDIPGEQGLQESFSNRKDIHIRVLLGEDLLPLINIFTPRT